MSIGMNQTGDNAASLAQQALQATISRQRQAFRVMVFNWTSG